MESKQIFSWVLRAVAIIICVGAVLLCVVSALLSILKLVQTYNTPASRYVQKTLTGYHIAPGEKIGLKVQSWKKIFWRKK